VHCAVILARNADMIEPASCSIEKVNVSVCRIPTDAPEQDGTLGWDETTVLLVEVHAGRHAGIGFSYADRAAAILVHTTLAEVIRGRDALAVTGSWEAMIRAIRNQGRPGLSSMAIAAVDVALWDLKAHLLELPLVSLLGAVRDGVAVYGSGGFTSYPVKRLQEQLSTWVDMGIGQVKMKVGAHPEQDMQRVEAARHAIGSDVELFVDANGAYGRKQALGFAERFADYGVTWFEEPVSSDDLAGLRFMRDRGPSGMDITAGEYGYDLPYFLRMLQAGAVDVLMPDATRCAGITGFLQVTALCRAFGVPLSAHTAPSIHVHPCCAVSPVRHIEFFHDHMRIEQMLFEGALVPVEGRLYPDRSRPGIGLTPKRSQIDKYSV
jgi:L-alanine-DL-glutamate epimerase-like enolase superfamily enzyme